MAHGDDSESWRGEERRPPAKGLFAAMFGEQRELTPEEQQRLAADIQRCRDEAAVRSLVLPSFNQKAVCPKCGGQRILIGYCQGGTADKDVFEGCYRDTAGQEHLHRVCETCRFGWCEKTLDAGALA